MPRDDACVGALVGTFVGDAIGMPVEGWPPERIRAEHGRITAMLPARMGAGTYTDDTQMMIALAESILEADGVDPEHLSTSFLDHHHPDRGYGMGTTRVLQAWRQGTPVEEAARGIFDKGSYGNGGSMRIAPVPARFHRDPEKLDEAARASCRVTHAHPLGIQGAILQAHAIGEAINATPSTVAPLTILGNLQARVDPALDDGTYDRALRDVATLLEKAPPPEDPARAAKRLGNDSRAFTSVPAAIYAAFANASRFDEAVTYAVGLGGDTDTIGAMAGAISGALHGFQEVPDRWWQALEQGTKGRDHVVDLGRHLAKEASHGGQER